MYIFGKYDIYTIYIESNLEVTYVWWDENTRKKFSQYHTASLELDLV